MEMPSCSNPNVQFENDSVECESKLWMEKLKDIDLGCSVCSNLFLKLLKHIQHTHSTTLYNDEPPVDLDLDHDNMVLIKTEQVEELSVHYVPEELTRNDWVNSVDFDNGNEVNDLSSSPSPSLNPGPMRKLRTRRKVIRYAEFDSLEHEDEDYHLEINDPSKKNHTGRKPLTTPTGEQPSTMEKPFACEVCGKSFRSKSHLREHMWTHTRETSHMCETCGRGFPNEKRLMIHEKSHTEKNHLTNITGEKPFECKTCGKSFRSKCGLSEHAWTHTRETSNMCETCGKLFPNARRLKLHEKTHTGENPSTGEKHFPCDVCGKSFRSKGNLKEHSWIHTRETSHVCEICGKGYPSAKRLEGHVAIIHEGRKPYSCSTCGKQFSVSNGLTVHERTHTGEKPFTCETCGLSFSNASALVIHGRTHTGEKPYECDICGEKYRSAYILSRHKKSHGEKLLMCDICGKKFGLPQHLKQHKGFHKESV